MLRPRLVVTGALAAAVLAACGGASHPSAVHAPTGSTASARANGTASRIPQGTVIGSTIAHNSDEHASYRITMSEISGPVTLPDGMYQAPFSPDGTVELLGLVYRADALTGLASIGPGDFKLDTNTSGDSPIDPAGPLDPNTLQPASTMTGPLWSAMQKVCGSDSTIVVMSIAPSQQTLNALSRDQVSGCVLFAYTGTATAVHIDDATLKLPTIPASAAPAATVVGTLSGTGTTTLDSSRIPGGLRVCWTQHGAGIEINSPEDGSKALPLDGRQNGCVEDLDLTHPGEEVQADGPWMLTFYSY